MAMVAVGGKQAILHSSIFNIHHIWRGQRKKLRKVKYFAQSHTTMKQYSWHWNQFLILKPLFQYWITAVAALMPSKYVFLHVKL